jgi:integrase
MTDTTDTPVKTRRRHFTDKSLDTWDDFKPGPKRKLARHPEKIGHYIIVQPKRASGAVVRSFAVQARDGITKKQVWCTIGRCGPMTVADAAKKGDEAIARIREGKPPVEPPKPPEDTLQALSDAWLQHYVVKRGLRTQDEIERKLTKYVLPRIGKRTFVDLKRSDIAKLLDAIAEHHGERQADAVYTVLMSIAHWHASRSDYVVTYDNIQQHSEAPARERVLDHTELRAIWHLASEPDAGPFGAIVRLALLTGQRRDKIISMRHSHIENGVRRPKVDDRVVREQTYDGVWHIPSAPREKGNGGDLVLPRIACDIIAAQPRLTNNDYVFPARGGGHTNNLHLGKAAIDAKLPEDFAPWRVHDLRRTCRTLMSEAGVDRDIAERVLGHRVGNKVEGIYNRFAYIHEKGAALAALAQHIEVIVGDSAAIKRSA